MDLEFTINNQTLKRTDTTHPVDLSNEYLKCQFDFLSDDWEDLGKFAIFRTGDKNYRVAINDGECIVPFDALQVNQFALTVYGVDGDTRITTNLVYIKLGKSGFVTEYDESSYFNPDMTEQLCEALTKKADKTYVDNGLDEKAGLVHSHIEADISDLKDYALVSDVPTKTSDLTNDVPFLTQHQDISMKADKSYVATELENKANTDVYDNIDDLWAVMDTKSDTDYVDTALDSKQDTLTDYTDIPNVETVNVTVTYDDETTETFQLLKHTGA